MVNVVHLACEKETKRMIMEDCVALFLEEHPEFTGMHISQGFILRRIAEFYLKT